jgi:hypothetical protein
MLVLSYTVLSCYYNCCTGGSTSSGNYGYPLYDCIHTYWSYTPIYYKGKKLQSRSLAMFVKELFQVVRINWTACLCRCAFEWKESSGMCVR